MTVTPSLSLPVLAEPRPEARLGTPVARLAALLALEARPDRIAVVGHDPMLVAHLRELFAGARVHPAEHAARAAGADAVFVAAGLDASFSRDRELVDALCAGLPPGGHLATLELRPVRPGAMLARLTSPSVRPLLGLPPRAPTPDRAFADRLCSTLEPLHRSEIATSTRLWRHVLFVGRKGSFIR